MSIFGIKLLGFTAATGHKLLLTAGLIAAIWLLRIILQSASRAVALRAHDERVRFWTRQTVAVVTTGAFFFIGVSIWFDNPSRLTTFVTLVTAGLAFALQKVVTAVAAYLVILRGKTFTVGDRITMGGVRGDVIALDFIQTTIMEMGQPPAVQSDEPAMWVRGRQFTGRIVTVNNGEIFNTPIFNFTRDFPYIWDELDIPIPYAADRGRAEAILLEAARAHALTGEQIGAEDLEHLKHRFGLEVNDLEPRVFYHLTDNWIELGLRYMVPDHGPRYVKDRMSRQIVAKFEEAGISIASGTYDIVGFPPVQIDQRSLATLSQNVVPTKTSKD